MADAATAPENARGPSPGYTIDELETASGIPARTIRFYRQSGLIATPERIGRRAFYDRDQLERLHMIAELRYRGLGLDAIAKVLDDPVGERQSLNDLLRMNDELRKPWIEDRAAVLTELELRETVGTDDPARIALLEQFGIITSAPLTDPPTYHVPSMALLELSGDIVAAGLGPELANQAWLLMQAPLAKLARELVALFTTVGPANLEEILTFDELMDGFGRLRPIALRAVQLSFAHEIERALDEFVEQGGVLDLRGLDGN